MQEINKLSTEKTEPIKRPVGRPRKFKSPEQMQVKIDEYFKSCVEHVEDIITKDGTVLRNVNIPQTPTIPGLAYHLGFCERGEFADYGTSYPEFSNTVKHARLRIEEGYVRKMADGKCNVIAGIFTLKNHYGYADKQEIDINSTIERSTEQVIGVLKAYVPVDRLQDAINELQARLSKLDEGQKCVA